MRRLASLPEAVLARRESAALWAAVPPESRREVEAVEVCTKEPKPESAPAQRVESPVPVGRALQAVLAEVKKHQTMVHVAVYAAAERVLVAAAFAKARGPQRERWECAADWRASFAPHVPLALSASTVRA
jgi:hypothetical protein